MIKHPISLEALQVLDEIDRRGSFAAASEHLDKVPSAISYIVQRLEEQLGVTLFQRQGRRSVLTTAGRYLVDSGRVLLQDAEQLAHQTQEIATGWEPTLRIVVDSVIDPTPVFEHITTLCEQHPTVEIDIFQEALGGTWEALIDDRAQLLIGAGAPIAGMTGVRYQTYDTLEMVFAVAPHHPLASCNEPLTKEQLAHQRWIVVHDSSRYSAPRDTGRVGSKKRIYVQTMGQKIAAQCVGMGVGYLPKQRILSYLEQKQLVLCEIADPPPQISDLYLAWKTAHRGRARQLLVDLMTAPKPN